MLWERKNDYKWKAQKDPFKKSEALEVLIVERMILLFLSMKNKSDDEVFITDVWLFEFWKYVQEKKEKLDPKLFERD